jgi:transcriptional regulator with XRE-family HTH domain
MLIQKLRLKQGWSQQQLAQASGLSVRTIQRIEAGHPASTETLKSLAAVFQVDFSTLTPEPAMDNQTPQTNEQLEAEAFRYVRRLRRFYLHLAKYLIVTLGLIAINRITSPTYMWSFWVAGGWGLGILLHTIRVFSPDRLLGPQWERRQVERCLGRPL